MVARGAPWRRRPSPDPPSPGEQLTQDARLAYRARGVLEAVDAVVRIQAKDRAGLERLQASGADRLVYHLPKPGPDGRTDLILTPLELIDRLAALIPPPRLYRHRYHGVLAPNAPLRAAVTALARVPAAAESHPAPTEPVGSEGRWRSPARYLWAMLLARLYEVFPWSVHIAGPRCASSPLCAIRPR